MMTERWLRYFKVCSFILTCAVHAFPFLIHYYSFQWSKFLLLIIFVKWPVYHVEYVHVCITAEYGKPVGSLTDHEDV